MSATWVLELATSGGRLLLLLDDVCVSHFGVCYIGYRNLLQAVDTFSFVVGKLCPILMSSMLKTYVRENLCLILRSSMLEICVRG